MADQAEAAVKAKDVAEEKTAAAEAINTVLAAQTLEADEKGYNEGVADVTADYEK